MLNEVYVIGIREVKKMWNELVQSVYSTYFLANITSQSIANRIANFVLLLHVHLDCH